LINFKNKESGTTKKYHEKKVRYLPITDYFISSNIEALNAALCSWLDGYSHVHENGSTKQSPKARF